MKKIFLMIIAVIILQSNVCYAEFSDVKEEQNKAIIEHLAEKGIINGTSENTFSPLADVTRAEFSKMVCLALKYEDTDFKNIFSDVSEDDWFYGYVNILASKNIINGYEDGLFLPYGKITNEQAAKILVSAYEIETNGLKYEGTFATFMNDYYDITPWAREYVNKGVMIGAVRSLEYPTDMENYYPWFRSEFNDYNPKGNLKRFEAAEIIYNVMNAIEITKRSEAVGKE